MKAGTMRPETEAAGKMEYSAHVVRQRDGGFLVEFPDLPGCLTEGDSLQDALANAREALSAWLYVAVKGNEEIPAPTMRRGRNYHPVSPDLDVAIPLVILWTRKKQGLTQEQVSKTLGITQQAYRKLEIPGKSNPRLQTLTSLFRALGLEMEVRPAL